jgi:S1-C subfamily serine protease
VREGWNQNPRYRQELRQLERDLRQELGDEDYDWLRYATGESNRVVVRDVLDRTPANRAGIRPGDSVRSYADRRIFTPGELKRATSRGEVGEWVRVELEREGEIVSVSVQRGPLGVVLDAETRIPGT